MCTVGLHVFDNGSLVALLEPGLHTITASYSIGSKCAAGTKIDRLEPIVSPLG